MNMKMNRYVYMVKLLTTQKLNIVLKNYYKSIKIIYDATKKLRVKYYMN